MKSMARRIAKLEALSLGPHPEHRCGGRWRSRAPFQPPIHFRFGNLRRLPKDHHGERHIEIAQCLPARNGQEWVEFAEVPGPRPSQQPLDPRLPTYLNVIFVEPYPERS
jgi:hypothetical protein